MQGRKKSCKNRIGTGWRPRTVLSATLGAALLALVAVPGCRKDEGTSDTETANQAITAADQACATGSVLVSLFGGLDDSLSPEDLASASAAMSGNMEPQDCATTQTNGAQVTWTLNDCTGPFGKAVMSGTVTATFRVGPRGTMADVTSSDLAVNEVPLEITATILYQTSGDQQSLQMDGTLTAQTRRFGQMSATGVFTVTGDNATSCISMDGTWNTSFGPKTWKTTATGITSCPDSCLTGSLTFEGSSRSYSLTFSGNGEVSWSLSDGQSGTIQTDCAQ